MGVRRAPEYRPKPGKGGGCRGQAKQGAPLRLTGGGGMMALAGTRTLLYIMLGSFPHIHASRFDSAGKFVRFPGERLWRFARPGDHGSAAIPKPVPTPKVQRRFTV